jgi:hypothetical protein
MFSSLSNIFNQITVNTGAELISKVTNPEEIYWRAKIKNQLTANKEKILVNEASLNIIISNFSLIKSE